MLLMTPVALTNAGLHGILLLSVHQHELHHLGKSIVSSWLALHGSQWHLKKDAFTFYYLVSFP